MRERARWALRMLFGTERGAPLGRIALSGRTTHGADPQQWAAWSTSSSPSSSASPPAIIGKAKGSSFWIWFLIGAVLPLLGLIAVILYRVEKDEPERQCPNCHKALKLYVQVCPRCGTDLYLPDPAAVRHPGVE